MKHISALEFVRRHKIRVQLACDCGEFFCKDKGNCRIVMFRAQVKKQDRILLAASGLLTGCILLVGLL